MTVTEQIDQKHQEDLQRLRGFRLLDDDFLTKCFEGDTASIELVLQIVLEEPDLKVLDVRTQVFVENLLNRSVRLDILATDRTGAKLRKVGNMLKKTKKSDCQLKYTLVYTVDRRISPSLFYFSLI